MPQEDDNEMLTKLATMVWGPFGNNGLNGKSQEQSKQIGELYGRTEQLGNELERRLGGIYRMLATLTVSMLVGAIGIIATLLVTK